MPPLKEQWEKEEKKRQKEAMWASVPRRISSRQVSLQAAAEERERLEAIKAAQAREEAEKKAARDAAKVSPSLQFSRFSVLYTVFWGFLPISLRPNDFMSPWNRLC